MADLRVRVGSSGRSDTVPFPSGWVKWDPPSDHGTVTSYEGRVRVDGSETVVATQNFGHPIPHSTQGNCRGDMTSVFSGLAAGNYTLSVAAINPYGETDSDVSSAFSLPLT
jgi:hypothetical protein